MIVNMLPRDVHVLVYTNHRGIRSTRHIRPLAVWWGSTEWHPQEQYLLKAWDIDKSAERDFALSDIEAWETPNEAIRPGLYRHFKGGLYVVLGTVYDSENPNPRDMPLVRYRMLTEDFLEWVRPVSMFSETVSFEGRTQQRFEYIGYGFMGREATDIASRDGT